ncbi:hypothetical protein CYMTET_34272 [Cymbomonas tetramitiformis]|uniref:Uncharacterized protein n=1 Tax=Cymbomonas tetramitiformis TaxID=36881 RepID=A0AAE0FBD8_9CHLO|nr:hypothetical protein CYMTET_34272 [Cymbomonas tetramitiformis]
MEDETTPPSLQEMSSKKKGKVMMADEMQEFAGDEKGSSDNKAGRDQKGKPRLCTNALECLTAEDEEEENPPQPTSPRDRHRGFDRHGRSNLDGPRPLWILSDDSIELKERAKRPPSQVWIAFVFLFSIPFIPIYLLYELYRRNAPTMYAEGCEYCCIFACPRVANDCSGRGQSLPLRCCIMCLVTFVPIELCRDLRNEALKGISLQMWIACKYMVDWIYDRTAGPLHAWLIKPVLECLARQLIPAKPYTCNDFYNDCQACWKGFSACCCYCVPKACKCCEGDEVGNCECCGCCKPCFAASCCPTRGDCKACLLSCSCNPRAWYRACYNFKCSDLCKDYSLMDFTIVKFLYFVVYKIYQFVVGIFKCLFNIQETKAYQGDHSTEGEYMIRRQVDVEDGYGTTDFDARDDEGRPKRFIFLNS